MIELFHSPKSTCSQKVRLALAEKGLAYESRLIDLSKREQHTPEYLAINPNGVIPSLRHAGHAVRDSSVICEYLDEVFPIPPLMSSDARARAGVREWMRFIEEVPTAAIRVPTANQMFAKVIGAMSEAEFEKWSQNVSVRRDLYLLVRRADFGDKDVREALAKLDMTIRRVDAACAKSAWIAGDSYSLADIGLLPTIVRMEDMGYAAMWSEMPNFSRWYMAAKERPSFKTAYFAGSRMDPSYKWSKVP
ncbi:MAG: glutathione S-transferase family protein [Rhizobiaceae bacterium]|nr:glutathione S-transferase family protein [Rhizobiaceae bacterium]